ncbi:MAG: PIN domain-containing protein [Verrucomicrobiales bacterium]|nr:PIN domain-containing protein [Verrucomicrobiales bacterium]
MMTLIDTAAWIEFFRSKGNPVQKARVADLLMVGQAAYTCAIRFELFLGARPSEIEDLCEGLGFAERIVLLPVHWDTAASYGAELRAKGFIIPASDLLIAALAAEEGLELISPDKHFVTIQREILPALKLS